MFLPFLCAQGFAAHENSKFMIELTGLFCKCVKCVRMCAHACARLRWAKSQQSHSLLYIPYGPCFFCLPNNCHDSFTLNVRRTFSLTQVNQVWFRCYIFIFKWKKPNNTIWHVWNANEQKRSRFFRLAWATIISFMYLSVYFMDFVFQLRILFQ